jgi:kynurenine formamidase
MRRSRLGSLGLLPAAIMALAMAATAGESDPIGRGDSRGDLSGLPEGERPWWPSRYGPDDQIGTLNEITPEVTAKAARLVRQGRTLDLGRVLDSDTPKFRGRYWHQSVDVSAHYTNPRRADSDGIGWGRNRVNWIGELQTGTFQVGTQLDSIGHLQIGQRFYNGWTVADLVEPWGLGRFGMETVPPIVTRGVLVDMAAQAGVARLDKGQVIGPAEFQAALKAQGLSLAPGDAVLIHTGWGGLWGKDNPTFLSGEPGPGLALIEWLHERRVALVGTDTWSIGPVPGEDPGRPFQVPQTMYVKMGLFGLENLATEVLVEAGVQEFLFVLTHAKTRGSTAAVIAPAAVY